MDVAVFEKALKQKVESCMQLANSYFNSNIASPNIRTNQRGRAAGTAYLQRHEVRFNYYMYQQNPDEFIRTVVPHEIAHLFVHQLFGAKVKPHGKEWQAVMAKVFALDPERTHSFEVKPPAKSFHYRCNCSEHRLTIRRHNKVLKGCIYQCRQCKTSLIKV